jgi:hypothetical protein
LSIGRTADSDDPPIDQLDYVVRTTPSGEFALPIPLGGPVGTVTEKYTKTLDPPEGGGVPLTREEYRLWVAIDGTDLVLSVKHDDITPNESEEHITSVPIRVKAQATSHVELRLVEGTVHLLTPDE